MTSLIKYLPTACAIWNKLKNINQAIRRPAKVSWYEPTYYSI